MDHSEVFIHDDASVVQQTLQWIRSVVIECNFCPFAAKPVAEGKVHFSVCRSVSPPVVLEELIKECHRLDEEEEIETTLFILPAGFEDFEEFLDLLDISEELLDDQDYTGIYQLASFHPLYLFEDAQQNDPANYTNRSPYPMLQLLREESVEQVLKYYKHPEEIPERNIRFAREKGLLFMQQLRQNCLKS